ncbi:hypothetical protein [Prosthecobacter sp.]|uniref:hypothetical protein n=1 Tax=Prosthecobacter sp. TaxID=1965333 RepID=UPI00378412EF
MRFKLIALLVFPAAFAAAQSVGDFSIPYKANANGPMVQKSWSKGNSTLWGTDPSGNPQSITIGSGLTLTGNTLTSSGGGSGGSGTVTSVGMTVPTFLSVTGSPITTSGTFSLSLSGIALPVANGGTGQTTWTDGQIAIGNSTGNTLTKATLTAGSGITVTNGGGSITLSIGSSAITNTMLAGSIALSKLATDPLSRANHTGTQLLATISDAGALAALNAVASAQITDGTIMNADISSSAAIATSKINVSSDVKSVLDAANFAAIRTALSLVPGTDVQAHDGKLDTLAAGFGGVFAGPGFVQWNGTTYVLASSVLGTTQGGTGIGVYATGDIIYCSSTGTLSRLAGNTSSTIKILTSTGSGGNAQAPAWSSFPAEIVVACSDESTDITTGAAKVRFRMPHAMTVSAVRLSVSTAPTGSVIIVNVKESGTTIFSTKPQIATSAYTSVGGAVPGVLSDTSLADDAEITIDLDQIGSTIAGKGLKVTLIGTR